MGMDCLLAEDPPPDANWFMDGALAVVVALDFGEDIRLSMSMFRPELFHIVDLESGFWIAIGKQHYCYKDAMFG